MKIAIITPVLAIAGGIGRVVEEYGARLAERGHDVTIFVPDRKKTQASEYSASESRVKIVYLKTRLSFGYAAAVASLDLALKDQDVINFHYPFIGGVGALCRWHKKNPAIRLVVNYHMDLLGRGIMRPIFRLYQKMTLPKLMKTAHTVIVSSLDYAKNGDLKNFISDKITELPFGIDTEKFKPQEARAALLKDLGIESDESIILFVGGINRAHYFKGVQNLVRSFYYLKKEAKKVRLVIVGSGDLLNKYKKLTKDLKIDKDVVFCPKVASEDLPHYYNIADLLVLPSTDRSEAFGLVLLEAESSGVPVVASDLAGVRTVLEDQKTGFLVSKGDTRELYQAFAWCLTHPEELKIMGFASRERVLNMYQWGPIIDKLESLLK